ncbi:expressed unknown protein [Ectocarpus siliculosus]|uniref:Uncharacterized protein n=1 Tax=Ectocarpus siliculosus TaxID=2880 RepID=D8LBD5_ECTSI|nr:expressed unknown protein [Ectocarpus siliculosus]|eukprot:CBN76644.1 expressed unknown protein [Ectocarpus siliculosus]
MHTYGLLLKETESQLVESLTSGGAIQQHSINTTACRKTTSKDVVLVRGGGAWGAQQWREEGGCVGRQRASNTSLKIARFVIASLSHTPPGERPLQERRAVPPTPGGRHSGRTCSSSAPESHSQPWIKPRKGQGRKDMRLANQRILQRERSVHHDTHREPRIYIFQEGRLPCSFRRNIEIHQAFSSRRQCIPSRGTPPFPSQLECPPNAGPKARTH